MVVEVVQVLGVDHLTPFLMFRGSGVYPLHVEMWPRRRISVLRMRSASTKAVRANFRCLTSSSRVCCR